MKPLEDEDEDKMKIHTCFSLTRRFHLFIYTREKKTFIIFGGKRSFKYYIKLKKNCLTIKFGFECLIN